MQLSSTGSMFKISMSKIQCSLKISTLTVSVRMLLQVLFLRYVSQFLAYLPYTSLSMSMCVMYKAAVHCLYMCSQVSANDSEAQNDIRYGIVTGSTADFSLDPETGVLSTRRPLDREVAAQYVLTVQAVDGVGSGSRTGYTQVQVYRELHLYICMYICSTSCISCGTIWSHLQVTVTVEDENDITPSFPLNSFSYLIPESSPPSSALTPSLTATDTDLGANAAIDYYLQPPTSDSQPFQVDSSSGVVTLAENRMLDRETTPTYTLLLQAVDRGSPSRTGSIELTSVYT